MTLFPLFILHKNVGDFKFESEEQKKVHPYVDMTNISPPSEKNVPLVTLANRGSKFSFKKISMAPLYITVNFLFAKAREKVIFAPFI